jgi:hypothetical protein
MTNRQPRVFVSSPATLTDTQAIAQSTVLDELGQREMRTVRLQRSQYAPTPWNQLRTAVAHSDGAVVFGFRQLHIETGEWRPETGETRSGDGWHATSWSQIEAGLAIMASLPVLVTADPEVTEGVFAPDVWGENLFGVRHDRIGQWETSSLEAFEAWTAAVLKQAGRVDARVG